MNLVTHARQGSARPRSSQSGFGKWRRGLALSGLLLLLVLAWGCEDDSNLGFGLSCITFVPNAVPIAGEVVAQVGAESGCDVVVVELVVTGVADVFAASFEINFPDAISLISNDLDVSNSFLGDDAIQVLQEISPGIVEGGVTRVGSTNGGVTPDDTNNVLLKVAFFRAANSGSGALSFNDANLIIAGTPPVAAVPAVPFRGGTLMIIDQLP